MKSITGKPDQICKSLVKFFGEAKFELSSNEQTKVNQAKVWERNVGGQRNKSARTLSWKVGSFEKQKEMQRLWRKISQEEKLGPRSLR